MPGDWPDFGLDHQDVNFNNAPLGTCMDYTGNTLTSADIHPDAHDYEQLAAMYGDGGDKKGGGGNGGGGRGRNNRSEIVTGGHADFGRAIAADASGRHNVFEKNLGNGESLITHVFWAN